ncbi:hypothetical protein PB31_34 [Pseudomonas phage vB_PaeM_B31]|uniref:hypothetical protein n=1 Tax=Pseudomonas phage vB_PaeM_B31 TaxID=3022055 RepID=UPI0024430029|nr:hypothetical protein QE333_gp034 [Pseudomonas phage vB_PaeM_B31]WBW49066.1 hypothetical protein PB31_34 [Pseudomonas phage vB_PaeM_B31]
MSMMDPKAYFIKQDLEEATKLLERTYNLLDNVHCYDTAVYEDIGAFLYGQDCEEVE